MDFWGDVWSFLTGVGTLALAAATFAVILQGKRDAAEAERQHRDRLKPICVLTPYDGVDPWNQRGKLIGTISPKPENPSIGFIAISCFLQNVGTGPALKLRIRFRFLDMAGWSTEPWELAPLGAGETRGRENYPLYIPIQIRDQFNVSDFASFNGKPWEIWLEYRDVFGTEFQSVHSKILFNPNPTSWGWTTPTANEQPKAIMPPIPWFSYHEGALSVEAKSWRHLLRWRRRKSK
jgi:hypothetical protein